MAKARGPRYVDIANPDLDVDCPYCGLRTQRFLDHCSNCGYKLWPSSEMASAAFKAWQAADPARRSVSRFDLVLPVEVENLVDYEARAHQLGIHIFPNSNWPFTICLGALFLGVAGVPFPAVARVSLAVIGAIIFLTGVVGWVIVEDVKIFPSESAPSGEAHH